MFSKPYEIMELKDYPDHRGNIFEILRFKDQEIPGTGQIYCFSIVPGVRRGDHFHTTKREWASCVYGKVYVAAEDMEGNKSKMLLDSKKPSLIYFHPYTTHVFINEGSEEAVVVSYSSKQLDKENPDTIPKIIDDKDL